MKDIQFKITSILLIIGTILLSINNAINLKGLKEHGENIETAIAIWIATVVLFSICIIVVVAYCFKLVAKVSSKGIEKDNDTATDSTEEIKYLEEGRKNNEENLAKSSYLTDEELRNASRQKNQVDAILLHIKDGIIAFNLNGNLTYINPAAIDLFRLEKNDDTFDKIFRKIDLDVNLEKIVYLDDVTSFEQTVYVGERYINVFFAPLKDSNNIRNGILILLQDITEHVRLDNMRKEFVADVSHELKTPITSIRGYADTLLDGEYDKETQVKFLNVISTESERMAKLVTDLLTLSRYDNNKNKTEVVEIDLGDMTKKCLEKVDLEIEKKHHKVECFVTADVPPVRADKYGVERVILNILTNSIKYTPENGNIKIYVGFVYNDAYIKVIDNGIGIPEEDLPRIFERFYRVDKARARELGGTGLGLAIAKEIIEKNNGSIDIKSQVGKGTEVVVRIPVKTREIIENN